MFHNSLEGAVTDCSLPRKNELQIHRYFIRQSEFMSEKQSIYHPGWLPGRIASFVVVKPLLWALEQLGVVGDDGILTTVTSGSHIPRDVTWSGEYVVVPLVEITAEEVVMKQKKKPNGATDRLYSFDDFRKEFGTVLTTGTPLGETDALVLLRFLQRDKKVLLFDQKVW